MTLNILGYFIGTLSFSILSLFLIKPDQIINSALSPFVGIFLLIIAILVFALFIHFISKSIQVTLYIQNLVKEASEIIEKRQKVVDENSHIINGTLDKYKDILNKDFFEITTNKSGFIQHYDEKRLF